ncbi:MAG: hypothetical protein ABI401_12695 [Candidatus Dormibacter sp.]
MKSNRGSKAADSLREPWRRPSEPRHPSPQGRATFHLPGDLLNEMRNTVVALAGPPHRLTMSKLAEVALRRELQRLRNEQSGTRGKAFGQRADEVTRGRPIR